MHRDHPEVLGTYDSGVRCLATSRDAYALGGRAPVAVRASLDGEVVELEHLGSVSAAAFSPSGRWLATGSSDMGVRFFGRDGALHQLGKGHYHAVCALLWLDEDTLLTGSRDGTLARFSSDAPRALWRSEPIGGAVNHLARGDAVYVGTPAGLLELDDALEVKATLDTRPCLSVAAEGDVVAFTHREGAAVFRRGELTWTGPGVDVAVHDGAVAVVRSSTLEVRRGDEVLLSVEPHDARVGFVAATPWGWLTGSADGVAQLTGYDGEDLGGVRHRSAVVRGAVAGDRLITVGGDAEVRGWRVGEAQPIDRVHRVAPARELTLPEANAVACDDEGRFGVATVDGFHVSSVADAELHVTHEAGRPCWYAVHGAGVWGTRAGEDRELALMRAERTVGRVAGFYAPKLAGRAVLTDAVALHRVDDGEVTPLLETEGNWHGSTLSPSGAHAMVAAKDGSTLVEVEGGARRALPVAQRSAFSADGQRLAFATGEVAVIVDVATGAELSRVPTGRVWSLVFSPDAQQLAIATSAKEVHLVDVQTGRVTATLRSERGGACGYKAPVWTPDGERVAVGSHIEQATLFDRSGAKVRVLEGVQCQLMRARVVGDRLLVHASVSPAPDLTLQLWTFDGELVATLPGHEGRTFWQVNASPSGRWVVTLVDGDAVRLWATEDGACTILPVVGARGASFSGDDALVTVERSGRVRVFEL